jgi:hypothetical protein
MLEESLVQRYNEFTADDTEERVNSPHQLLNDYNFLCETVERAIEFYVARFHSTDDLIVVVESPYVYKVLLGKSSIFYSLGGPIKLIYEPDTSWGYAGEGYWTGKDQVANVNIQTVEHHNKYCWQCKGKK